MTTAALVCALGFVAELTSTRPEAFGTWIPDLVPALALVICAAAVTVLTTRLWSAGALLAGAALWFAANGAEAVPGAAGDVLAYLTYSHRGFVVASLLLLSPRPEAWLFSGAAIASTLVAPLMTEPDLMLAWATVIVVGGLVASAATREPGRVRTGVAFAVLAGTVAAVAGIAKYGEPESAAALATAVYQAGMTASAVAVLVAALARRARTALVADAVVRLAMGSVGPVRDQLSGALRDPELDVAFATPRGWVDELGRTRDPVRTSTGREKIRVEVDGAVVAELSCRADMATARQVVTSIEAATRLAARNANLNASLRSEADRLRGSRRRLLLVEDEARRGLAARLRTGIDGPFHELRDAAAALSRDPGLADAAARCLQGQRVLRAELERLAAGLGPGAMESGDLGTSLGLLTKAAGLEGSCTVTDAALPRAIATTAYLVCAEAITNVSKHALARSLNVTVEIDRNRLLVMVADDGVGGARVREGTGLSGLAHRVTALGGTLEVFSLPGQGTRLLAIFDTEGAT